MSSSRTYSVLSLDHTHFISLGQVDLDQEKGKEIGFNTEGNNVPHLLQNRQAYDKTDFCELCQIWKQFTAICAQSEKKSTNKNSITDALKPAVFSVNFTQFPHGFALMVRIMKVYSSQKIPKGYYPQESFRSTLNSAMGSSSCESVVQLLCETRCGRIR